MALLLALGCGWLRRRLGGSRSLRSTVLLLVVGLLAGVVTRTFRSEFAGPVHYETLLAVLLLGLVCLARAVGLRGSRHGLRSFQLEALALWAAFASGWCLVHGFLWADLLTVSVLWWLGCAVFGGFVVRLGARRV